MLILSGAFCLWALNLDGFGIQELQVKFRKKNAGYNLEENDWIHVKFLMKSKGGCFLPFGGTEAIITREGY